MTRRTSVSTTSMVRRRKVEFEESAGRLSHNAEAFKAAAVSSNAGA